MTDDLQPDCPFCKKITRRDRDTRFENERPIASFEPLNPVTPGHRLFIPTWHVEHQGATARTAVTACIASAYNHATASPYDFNLITSSGSAATQTVPHIHIHYVPRRPGDGLHLPWAGQQR